MDVEWSTIEINMDVVAGSREKGINGQAQPGEARGCKYGNMRILCPITKFTDWPWISADRVDSNGYTGTEMDGVRNVFPFESDCWIEDQRDHPTAQKREQEMNKRIEYNSCQWCQEGGCWTVGHPGIDEETAKRNKAIYNQDKVADR